MSTLKIFRHEQSIVNVETGTIISTRLLNVMPHTVFNAFSNPESLKHWWGPKGFTNTINRFEFKPGGMWEFVMHGPDGTDYYNRCEFKEIMNHSKIVFIHYLPVHHFEMTLGFEAIGDQTNFSFTMVFEDENEVDRIKQFVVPANEENFDRLEAFIKHSLTK